MNAKDYLHEIRRNRRRVNMLTTQVERETARAAGISAIRYDRVIVQSSKDPDRMTDIIAELIEVTEVLKNEIIRLNRSERAAIEHFSELKKEHARVLILHYIDDRTLTDVADELGYSIGYVYELRDGAMEELQSVLDKTEKI